MTTANNPHCKQAVLEALVARNDRNATRIWNVYAGSMAATLAGASLVPLYRCFSPRKGAPEGFNQLSAPLLLVGINPATPKARGECRAETFVWEGTSPSPAVLQSLKAYEREAECKYRRHSGDA